MIQKGTIQCIDNTRDREKANNVHVISNVKILPFAEGTVCAHKIYLDYFIYNMSLYCCLPTYFKHHKCSTMFEQTYIISFWRAQLKYCSLNHILVSFISDKLIV